VAAGTQSRYLFVIHVDGCRKRSRREMAGTAHVGRAGVIAGLTGGNRAVVTRFAGAACLCVVHFCYGLERGSPMAGAAQICCCGVTRGLACGDYAVVAG